MTTYSPYLRLAERNSTPLGRHGKYGVSKGTLGRPRSEVVLDVEMKKERVGRGYREMYEISGRYYCVDVF